MLNIQNIVFCLLLISVGCSKKIEHSRSPGGGPLVPGGNTAGQNTGDDEFPTDDDASSSSTSVSSSSSSSSTSISSSVSSSSSTGGNYSCQMNTPLPVNGSTTSHAQIKFSCNCPAGTKYQCRIGSSSAWGPCSSNDTHQVVELSVGLKRFEVRGVQTNNAPCGSAFYEWNIVSNLVASIQDSSLVQAPASVKLNFSATGGTAPRSFECQMGAGAAQACTPPWTPSNGGTQAGATYQFALKAKDAANNVSPVQSRSWTNGNWLNFPAEPTLACGQSIAYERKCEYPVPSAFNNSTLLTGLSCNGDRYKTYTRTCVNEKVVASTYETSVQNLRYWNKDCSARAPQSLEFRDAIQKFCSANAYWAAGWGPVSVEVAADINASLVKASCFTPEISQVLRVSDATLRAAVGGCNPNTNATGYECHRAANTHCRNQGFAAGYGVSSRATGANQIVCMKNNSGRMVATSQAALRNYNPYCDFSDPISLSCRNATHYFCKALNQGYNTGIGLYGVQGGDANVFCVSKMKEI